MTEWLSKVRSQIRLSGLALATKSVPMLPAAALRFSTTTGTPSRCYSPGKTTRDTVSVEAPAAKATMIRIVPVGQDPTPHADTMAADMPRDAVTTARPSCHARLLSPAHAG